jgi:crotonobetainyl-CoA:carnitine CoA-transferase CaiB-like acyl-CoA transferase
VAAGVVQNFADLQQDPQLAHRQHFVPLEHRHLGQLHFERSGMRLSDAPGVLLRPGPELGEHSRQLLSDLLGLSDSQIDALIADGVVG